MKIRTICYFVVLITIIYVCYQEQTYVKQYFESALSNRPSAAVTLSKNVEQELLQTLHSYFGATKNKFIFIDFGCAEGNVIAKVYQHPSIQKCVGVELESKLTDKAQERFKNIPNIEIWNLDMNDYKYEIAPTILFIYEPLWELNTKEAKTLYRQILSSIPPYNDDFYIIYVSGVINKHLNTSFFASLDFKQLKHVKLDRLLGLKHNDFYLFKKMTHK